MFMEFSYRAPRRFYRGAMIAGLTACCAWSISPAGAQVTADLQLIPSQIYYISDFDINGTGAAADLFNLTINNAGAAMPARLRIFMTSDRSALPIVDGLVQATLNPGGQTLTYRNFRGLNAQVISFTYNVDAVGQITDAVLRTGRLPSGTYYITVQVLSANTGQLLATDTAVLVITNPTTLDLISPGQLAGGAECPLIFSNLPQFTWNSDADRFLLTICEKLPSNSSPEDVMQNPPRFQRILNRGADFWGTPSFLYPSSALPLQPGRIYYWQITALTTSTSGEVRLPGEIWCFQVQNDMGGGNRALMLQELLSLLASLGWDDLQDLFAPGAPLEAHLPTGRVIINGRIVDVNELFAMLRGGAIRIKSFSVE